MNYDEELEYLQVELLKWQNRVKAEGSKHIIIFEGFDCGGKTGTIRRFTEHLNPRGARIVALHKPTEEERQEWSWQRWIRQFPRQGEIVFFDRSWYSRAIVESVMGYATRQEVYQFYNECPPLEKIWINSGISITKFWFDITKSTQHERLTYRATDPLKMGKLSEVDLQAQARWDQYVEARDRMFKLTSTKLSPWITIDSNDKKTARLTAMRHILNKFDCII